jgi:hypothetical protein
MPAGQELRHTMVLVEVEVEQVVLEAVPQQLPKQQVMEASEQIVL